MIDHALALAGMGFYVFPLEPMGKTPVVSFPEVATRDEAAIRAMWTCPVMGWPQDFNVGVYTGRFGDGQALLVVDVDVRDGKHGEATLLALEIEGADCPDTREVVTPSGGRHLYYVVDEPVKQGANVLGPGVDVRSAGGYVVGVGSVTEEGEYRWA